MILFRKYVIDTFCKIRQDVEDAIIKVENKEMTYEAFFHLVYFNKI